MTKRPPEYSSLTSLLLVFHCLCTLPPSRLHRWINFTQHTCFLPRYIVSVISNFLAIFFHHSTIYPFCSLSHTRTFIHNLKLFTLNLPATTQNSNAWIFFFIYNSASCQLPTLHLYTCIRVQNISQYWEAFMSILLPPTLLHCLMLIFQFLYIMIISQNQSKIFSSLQHHDSLVNTVTFSFLKSHALLYLFTDVCSTASLSATLHHLQLNTGILIPSVLLLLTSSILLSF